ncbi:CorA Metal Ion Transporter (MIT) Family (nucleomorph) [Cryptomonas paramecium]|uniref:Magnesium transporter n=1 Tax=Cryptomonas paramaecium TaxID=2898 RepID=F2HHD7_9CRYP|nr:CorA Metal Ion Transporter (MIT) Family [Cryptomonas paramecium]AEA38733.1 CorA Metal Ion Transporter (MIT) Family [Cryptomonas paramecium]|mmetsp:Transcript_39312/g.104186  ORF Transcript_39312/g.104186 Transcript_39312/m.104186 type:complete len:374 (+) Transcript_39312:2100-3221(+)
MKSTELLCLEFNLKGNCILRRFKKLDLLQESRISVGTHFFELQLVYSKLISKKKINKFPFNIIHEKDKNSLMKFFRRVLQIRDIRQIDPAFSARPALWIRYNAILVSLEQIRAVILCDKLFLFDPDNPKVQKSIKIISEKLRKDYDADIETPNMPYEFKALEGILINVCVSLEKNFSSLEPTILENLDDLPTKLTSRQLEELRSFKQRLNQFSSRSQDVQKVLQDILEEDENMLNMYLSEKIVCSASIRNLTEHEEIEILAENYLQIIDYLTSRAKLLDNAIDDTEDLVSIRLDTIRNRILFVELTLNIISLAFAAGGLVAAVFGMNLSISIFKEENSSQTYFFVCIFLIIHLVIGLYWWLFKWCKEKGLYSI